MRRIVQVLLLREQQLLMQVMVVMMLLMGPFGVQSSVRFRASARCIVVASSSG